MPWGDHDAVHGNASLDFNNDGDVPGPLQFTEPDQFAQLFAGCITIALEYELRTINFLIIHPVSDVVGAAQVLPRRNDKFRNLLCMLLFKAENFVALVPGLVDPFRQGGFLYRSDRFQHEPFSTLAYENSAMRVGRLRRPLDRIDQRISGQGLEINITYPWLVSSGDEKNREE